jgi:hypothetical protein
VRIQWFFVVFVQTLGKSEPKGKESDCLKHQERLFVCLELHRTPSLPRLVFPIKKAVDCGCFLQHRSNTGQNVGQEEVTEPNEPEWRNNNLLKSLQQLHPLNLVASSEWVPNKKQKHEAEQECKYRQVLLFYLINVNLPSQAKQPNSE